MGVSRYERGATMHGTRRVRERLRLPARAVRRLVARARAEGVGEADMPAWLQIAVGHKRGLHPEGSYYVFFDGHLFVFSADSGNLITVYPLRQDEPEHDDPDWERIRARHTFH